MITKSDLEEQLVEQQRKIRELEDKAKKYDQISDQLSARHEYIKATKPVISLSQQDAQRFLGDERFRRLCIKLFELGPRKHRFRKAEIQQLKLKAFNRFKELLIKDYQQQTGRLHTGWNIAGVSLISNAFDYISDNDKILFIASHPASLQSEDVPDMLECKEGIQLRVKLAIKSHYLTELMDQIKPAEYYKYKR